MRSLNLLCLACVVACGPSVEADTGASESEADTSSGSTTTSGPSTTTVSTSASASVSASAGPTTAGPTSAGPGPVDTDCLDTGCESSSGPPTECEQTEQFTCEGSVNCESHRCGGLASPFDEFGCLRTACEAGCPGGTVCFRPADWGDCASSGWFCSDDELGQCSCGSDDDCGGAFCVPEDIAPPTDCRELHGDEMACLGAGCGPHLMGRPVVPLGGGACLCELDEPRCLFLHPGTVITPGKRVYIDLSVSNGSVIVLDALYDPPPLGFALCDMTNSTCQCAAKLPCAMD